MFDNDASISYGKKLETCELRLDQLFAKLDLSDQICFEEYETEASITYQELDQRSTQLANILAQKGNI